MSGSEQARQHAAADAAERAGEKNALATGARCWRIRNAGG
jgi:hypothetical protein